MDYQGTRLKKIRIQNNDTQETLAQKLNISRQVISKWETNTSKPDILSLQKIADLYHVELNYFTNGNMETENQENQNPPRLFFPDTALYQVLVAFLSVLSVLFFGPISLFVFLPLLLINLSKRKVI